MLVARSRDGDEHLSTGLLGDISTNPTETFFQITNAAHQVTPDIQNNQIVGLPRQQPQKQETS